MRTARTIEAIIGEIDAVSSELDAQAAPSEALGTATPELVEIMRTLRVPMIKDRKSTRLNSSHVSESRMPSSA